MCQVIDGKSKAWLVSSLMLKLWRAPSLWNTRGVGGGREGEPQSQRTHRGKPRLPTQVWRTSAPHKPTPPASPPSLPAALPPAPHLTTPIDSCCISWFICSGFFFGKPSLNPELSHASPLEHCAQPRYMERVSLHICPLHRTMNSSRVEQVLFISASDTWHRTHT